MRSSLVVLAKKNRNKFYKMGGCCCSARKPHLHGTPVYIYCPPALEEHESLTTNAGTAGSLTAGLLVSLDLQGSTPDAFRPPPAPLPYDTVLGCPASTDSDSGRETVSVSSFATLITCEDIEDSECKVQANSMPTSPRKPELIKSNESHVLVTEEEDGCPICLEEYDVENPKTLTKCEHHFHLSCILEWMERSDSCPICDQVSVEKNEVLTKQYKKLPVALTAILRMGIKNGGFLKRQKFMFINGCSFAISFTLLFFYTWC